MNYISVKEAAVITMIDTEAKDKFECLYKTYRKLLFYVAKKILKDNYLAEDAVHNTFLKVIENIEKINDVECHKTRSLLVIMTKNLCINMYNYQKSHPMLPFDETLFSEDEVAAYVEDTDELMKVVLKLPELYRIPLTLKYIQGFPNRDIAATLDITEATVRKRQQRARKMIFEILRKKGV